MAREVAVKDKDEKSTAVAEPESREVAEGLEDVDAGDILLPIIKTVHAEGCFQDSLSNQKFNEFEGIVLGLVKNRILWPSEVGDEGELPLCRSLDFKHGRPHPVKFVTKDVSGQYPSKVSKLGKDRIQAAIEALEEDPVGADLDVLLPCASCALQQWETMPGGKTPWCTEQYIFPVIRLTDEGGFAPGYMTFQRASLKACRAYISVFKGINKPMYTSFTTVKAVHQKRGQVPYVTPEFTKGKSTDPELWASFSTDLHRIRTFLTTPRAPRDSEGDVPDDDDDADDETAPVVVKGKGQVIDTTATDADDTPDDDDETPPPPSARKGKGTPAPAPEPEPAGADDEADDDDDEEPF
jgi:hypothetical protein